MQELNQELDTLTESPDYKLYSSGQMTVVTILCSIIGGGLLLASNFSKLGKEQKARRTVYLSIVFFIVQMIFNAIFVVLLDPHGNPLFLGLNVAVAIIFGYKAEKWQGDDFADFFARGGKRNSNINAAILGLFATIGVMAFIFLIILAFSYAA